MRTITTIVLSAAVTFGLGAVALDRAPENVPGALTPDTVRTVDYGPHDGQETVLIEAGTVSDAMFGKLLDYGYRGDPTDGREALYPTREDAIAACYTDTDCLIADTSPGTPILFR